jgi:hypothetical protein
MPTLKGREAEQRRREQIPGKIGATVIADEAKLRVTSEAVRDGVVVGRAKDRDGTITVRVTVEEGWPRSLGTWLEYGTSGHFISVDPAYAEGRTAQRINKLDTDAAKGGREGPGASLVINGKPVGTTVYHPGAQAHPWLRPARDTKRREAVAAAQQHITAGVRRSGRVTDGDNE